MAIGEMAANDGNKTPYLPLATGYSLCIFLRFSLSPFLRLTVSPFPPFLASCPVPLVPLPTAAISKWRLVTGLNSVSRERKFYALRITDYASRITHYALRLTLLTNHPNPASKKTAVAGSGVG